MKLKCEFVVWIRSDFEDDTIVSEYSGIRHTKLSEALKEYDKAIKDAKVAAAHIREYINGNLVDRG